MILFLRIVLFFELPQGLFHDCNNLTPEEQLAKEENNPLNLHTLSQHYTEVIHEHTQRWKKALLGNYPAIFHQKDEKDWLLLVRDTANNNFDAPLMTYLISKFNYSDAMICSQKWRKKCDAAYLWIKRDKWDDCITRFKLHITP